MCKYEYGIDEPNPNIKAPEPMIFTEGGGGDMDGLKKDLQGFADDACRGMEEGDAFAVALSGASYVLWPLALLVTSPLWFPFWCIGITIAQYGKYTKPRRAPYQEQMQPRSKPSTPPPSGSPGGQG